MKNCFYLGLAMLPVLLGQFQRAAAGPLKFKGFISTANAGIDGLRGAHGIVFTQNGKSLYASASDGAAISWFSRDSLTGNLSYSGLIKSGNFSSDELGQPKSVALSPDAKTIYAGGFISHNVLWFNRNTLTDTLSFAGSISRSKDSLPSLSAVRNMVLSPDGGHLYTTASEGNAVFWFTRKATDGSLTYSGNIERVKDGIPELKNPRPIAVSKNGKFVYVGAHTGNSILCFLRDSQSGSLTLASVISDSQNGVDGLEGVQSIKLTDDDAYLFVAGYTDNSISWFSIAPSTGALTFKGIFRFPPGEMDPLQGASALEISRDGKLVFAGSYQVHCLSWFHRKTESSDLVLGGYSRNGFEGVEGITGIEYMLLSPDEKHLYVSAGRDASLAWFDFPDSSVLNTRIFGSPRIPSTRQIKVTAVRNAQGLNIVVENKSHQKIQISMYRHTGKLVFEKRYPGLAKIGLEFKNQEIAPGILALKITSENHLLYNGLLPTFVGMQ